MKNHLSNFALSTLAAGLAAGLLGVQPAVAADLGFTVEPAHPTTQDAVVLKYYEQVAAFRDLLQVTRDGFEIEIAFFRDPCAILCPPFVWDYQVPLGRLPAGTYHVDLDTDPDLTFEVTEAPLPPIVVEATQTSFAARERVKLSLTSRLPSCGERPSLGPIVQEGRTFKIELLSGDLGSTCDTQLFGLPVDLGQLDPGNYEAQVWARAGAAEPVLVESIPLTVAAAVDNSVVLLDRYRVRMTWKTADGNVGEAKPVVDPGSASALFTFFGAQNWEVLVKILDGCGYNAHRWVFAAAATDVEATLIVEDLVGNVLYRYTRAAGSSTLPLTDTLALPCS